MGSLCHFIREVGLPTTFTEMDISLAESTIITPGCCR